MLRLRNPLSLLIIGAVLGGILGAVVGIAIGTAGRAGPRPVEVTTVVSTRTIRVAGLTPLGGPSLPDTPPTNTAPVHGRTVPAHPPAPPSPTDTATTDTAPTGTTDTTTTETTPTPTDPNDVPPADSSRPPASFCSTHVCAASFDGGTGYTVQCADGVWTKQGGQPGACGRDGGLA